MFARQPSRQYSLRVTTNRSRRPPWLVATLIAVLALGAAACPSRSRKTLVPKVPTNGDAAALARFQQAQQKFERDRDGATAQTEEFEAIAAEYPGDPVAPYALLYAGITALRGHEYARAVTSLEKLVGTAGVDPGLHVRGRMFLGVSLTYEGRYADAVAPLREGERAIENDAERTEWNAAMAEALAATGDVAASLPHYDRFYKDGRPAERAYIVARLRGLVDQLDPQLARAAYDRVDHGGPSAAFLGLRVAAALAASGDTAGAARLRADTAGARRNIGLEGPGAGSGAGGNARLVGAVMPLSGKRGRIGELAARGMSMAAGAVGDSAMLGLDVSLRDSGSDASAAARQVEALAREGAIAVVGPVSDADVAAVTTVASREGLPVLSLAPRPRSPGQGVVFHVMQSAEDRAKALARYAISVGARDVAVLAPKSGYGRAVGAAFRDEIKALGGTVVSDQEYEPGETSFGKVIRSVRGPWQAVFVPDQAAKLALIAPALAAANLQSRPEGKGKTRVGRAILLLSTAEAVDDRYLRSAGRYSHGAVLAPGFYPDRTDATIARFVDRFELAFGREPGAWEAHAFDAARLVREAVDAGARSRAEVAAALAGTPIQGLTGTLRFGADGTRADDGLLFVVDKAEGADEYVIRARR